MGKLDTITKEYIRRPDIFADVFNQFIYHGERKILPGRLTELDTAEIAVPYGADNASAPEQRYRDVAKMLTAMTDGTAAYCILAIENEAKINYAMPVKDGLYDFLQLAKQVTETARSHKNTADRGIKPSPDEYLSGFWKNDRLLPVMTIVIYFGADAWDGPISLREMYADCDKEILKYVADYRINLITPERMTDKEIDEFHTSFREIMKYIKYSTNRKRLKETINSDDRFKNVERQAVAVINAATGSKVKYSESEETVNMCIAIQEIREEGRQEGRQEGRLEGRQEGRLEGEIIGVIRSDRRHGASQEDTKQYIMEEYHKGADEAEELIRTYWK